MSDTTPLDEIHVTSLDPREVGSQPTGEPTEPLLKVILREEDLEKTVLVGANLKPRVRIELVELLKEFSDVFA